MRLFDLLKKGVDNIEKYQVGDVPIFKTNIQAIDGYIPVIPGTTNYIASRPGQGKTRLIVTLIREMVCRYKLGWYIAEDNETNMSIRALSVLSKSFHTKEVYLSRLREQQYSSIIKTMGVFGDPRYINNGAVFFSSGWKLKQCIEHFKRLEDKGCQLIIYDYVQLIETNNQGIERHNEISMGMKEFFEKSSMALIGILQLNRDSEKGHADNPNRFPSLSHLFGSSSYEKDAFSISMIQRIWEKDTASPTGWKLTPDSAFLIKKNRLGGELPQLTLDTDYKLKGDKWNI